MKRLALAALLLATANSPSFAQSATHDHGQKDAPATEQPAAPKGQSGTGGMMGGGMMKGGKMPMMDMMQTMGMMRPGGGGMGMATIDRVEGRIAFLRTELKITDAQSAVWDPFADALRANAKSLGEVRAAMAGASQQGLIERFALQEKWLAARLEGTRAIKAALTNLIGTLSDEQKKAADELLAPHMGMMAVMQRGSMAAGAMPPGR
jgi:LTXXQ motif family protein